MSAAPLAQELLVLLTLSYEADVNIGRTLTLPTSCNGPAQDPHWLKASLSEGTLVGMLLIAKRAGGALARLVSSKRCSSL